MNRMSGSGYMSDGKKSRYDEPTKASDVFDDTQRGKPLKAVIGVILLAVLAIVLARMNPAPHESRSPSAPITQQTTGASAR